MSKSNLTGWVDIDRPQLQMYPRNYEQKVQYFRKRLEMTLLKPLKRVYSTISYNAKESGILIYATCTCCAMEALGKFILGGTAGKRQNFDAFILRMDGCFASQSVGAKKYKDFLWTDFRNGLAHGLTICHGGFEHQASYFAVKTVCGRQCLYIDPENFNKDFRKAVALYLLQLRSASPGSGIRVNFEKAFDAVFVHGV